MARMGEIGKKLEADWGAIRADLTGHHHQAAATATARNQQEAPGMSFTQSLHEDTQRIAQAAETLAGDPHIDALIEAALLAVHVPAPVFKACADMLAAAEAGYGATPAAGTPAAIAPPPAPADAPAHDPRAPQDASS
jgi:hypothetical protein